MTARKLSPVDHVLDQLDQAVRTVLGPPPPGEQEIAVVSLVLWLFVPWGYWVDRHRAVRPAVASAEPVGVGPEVGRG